MYFRSCGIGLLFFFFFFWSCTFKVELITTMIKKSILQNYDISYYIIKARKTFFTVSFVLLHRPLRDRFNIHRIIIFKIYIFLFYFTLFVYFACDIQLVFLKINHFKSINDALNPLIKLLDNINKKKKKIVR